MSIEIFIASYVLFTVIVILYLLKNQKYADFFIKTFLEKDKPSGKAISAFIFVHLIVISTLSAIIFTTTHLVPEYMFYTISGLILSLYAVKAVTTLTGKKDSVDPRQDVDSSQ